MSTAIDAPTFDGGMENRVVDGFTSLLDAVDSEDIAARYDIGLHSNRIDFLEHVKIGLRLGIADPNTFEDLAQQTDVSANLEPINKGHFSKLTARRSYQAVALTGTAQAVFPEPLVIEVGGITLFEIGPPQDLDGDGLYEDVTGDDKVTFGDVVALDIVVTFYERGDLALTDAQVAALDFNQDGRLTEADTTALARRLLLDR
jgi:hypothetical protein